ncbi:citrate-binding protein-like [Asparagus officinalis]|uniref:citrate-binding protein-like n=1 Tax=Asparagus officinalis TaxID=4686 RepID=UPI00098DF638|nr:citrate-binding protein-like [Asparagus officinalis]
MTSFTWFLFTLLASLNLLKDTHLFCSADPTDGFTAMPLSERNFDMQWPYNLNLNDRYSYVDGVRRLWVYSTDKPFKPSTTTKPRTEIRIRGYDYSSGVWQFEGYGFVPNGTSGTAIMQIHRTTHAATVLMLMVVDGQLKFYHSTLVESNIYDRWMRLNVIHDVDANKITVFIDGVKKLQIEGNGPNTFYFKCGVYAQRDEAHYMESRWRDIRVLKKNG